MARENDLERSEAQERGAGLRSWKREDPRNRLGPVLNIGGEPVGKYSGGTSHARHDPALRVDSRHPRPPRPLLRRAAALPAQPAAERRSAPAVSAGVRPGPAWELHRQRHCRGTAVRSDEAGSAEPLHPSRLFIYYNERVME